MRLEGRCNFSCGSLGPGCVFVGISLKHLLVMESLQPAPWLGAVLSKRRLSETREAMGYFLQRLTLLWAGLFGGSFQRPKKMHLWTEIRLQHSHIWEIPMVASYIPCAKNSERHFFLIQLDIKSIAWNPFNCVIQAFLSYFSRAGEVLQKTCSTSACSDISISLSLRLALCVCWSSMFWFQNPIPRSQGV